VSIAEFKPQRPVATAVGVWSAPFVAILSPAVHLPPGTPVAISAWVRIPSGITASPDGALLYDSIGGDR